MRVMAHFRKRSDIPVEASALFAWHSRRGALERLLPPWDATRVLAGGGGIEPGREVTLGMRRAGVPLRWRARHTKLEPNRSFVDEQVEGPFARWEHTHVVEPRGAKASLTDDIEYALPFGKLGSATLGRWVESTLERTFDFRHARTRGDVMRHEQAKNLGRMKVVVSGASGLVGTALTAFLETGGHEVVRLVRGAPRGAGEIAWDPAAGTIDARALEGADAVIHLSGENVSAGRWTDERKRRIVESRASSTELLSKAIAGLDRKPRVLLSASAIGIYGSRGDEPLEEDSAPGSDFLADVCRRWEGATSAASDAGIRVACLRFGVVLSPKGGALAKLLPLFQLGMGGRVGDGRQYMSFVGLTDAVYAAHHVLATPSLSGPVNVVGPEPVTNRELTSVLAKVLGRPAFLPVPRAAIELAFGEMGRETVLASQRVSPKRLIETGYAFEHPSLEDTLRFELGRPRGH